MIYNLLSITEFAQNRNICKKLFINTYKFTTICQTTVSKLVTHQKLWLTPPGKSLYCYWNVVYIESSYDPKTKIQKYPKILQRFLILDFYKNCSYTILMKKINMQTKSEPILIIFEGLRELRNSGICTLLLLLFHKSFKLV